MYGQAWRQSELWRARRRPCWLVCRPDFAGGIPVLLGRVTFSQLFEHLDSPTDSQHCLMQVRPLRLHFLELSLTLLKFHFQRFEPSLYLFPHGSAFLSRG